MDTREEWVEFMEELYSDINSARDRIRDYLQRIEDSEHEIARKLEDIRECEQRIASFGGE